MGNKTDEAFYLDVVQKLELLCNKMKNDQEYLVIYVNSKNESKSGTVNKNYVLGWLQRARTKSEYSFQLKWVDVFAVCNSIWMQVRDT